MWIEDKFEGLSKLRPAGLTIGGFDGVHRGHQALLRRLVEDAHKHSLEAIALTFDPLPRQVLGKKHNDLLTNLKDRTTYLANLGIDGVVVLPFNRDLAQTSAQDFVDMLAQHLELRVLWVGPDFTLGQSQEGDVRFLQQAGKEYGFRVHTVAPFLWQGKPVHSTRIRQALRKGDVVSANAMLGRPYHLLGKVVAGERRGRTLGFPTANLDIPPARLLPTNGIYVCRAHLARGTFGAVINVGTRPTFDEGIKTVEAHLLDFSADIYGEQMELKFLAYLRPERKFDKVETLVAQMQEDLAQARIWLMGDMARSDAHAQSTTCTHTLRVRQTQ